MTATDGAARPTSPMRVATVHWRTPGPTSVDEELAVYDDGSARLAVRVPRDGGAAIGTFTGRPGPEQVAALTEVGTIEVDLLTAGLPAGAEVGNALAAALRENPFAAITFSAAGRAGRAGTVEVGLYAVATGTAVLPFELAAASCGVLFLAAGRVIGWVEVPELPTGFVTADAAGLGGVGRPAAIESGGYGAIAFSVPMVPAADEIQVQVAGRTLRDLPDGAPTTFEVRTAPATISTTQP